MAKSAQGRCNHNSPRVHSKTLTRATWDRIGEVVGAPTGGGESTLSTSGSKVVYGRAWDYVFDVDVEDGAPPRRLPVDAGENPYIAAARFLENEDLPMTYRCVCV